MYLRLVSFACKHVGVEVEELHLFNDLSYFFFLMQDLLVYLQFTHLRLKLELVTVGLLRRSLVVHLHGRVLLTLGSFIDGRELLISACAISRTRGSSKRV